MTQSVLLSAKGWEREGSREKPLLGKWSKFSSGFVYSLPQESPKLKAAFVPRNF